MASQSLLHQLKMAESTHQSLTYPLCLEEAESSDTVLGEVAG